MKKFIQASVMFCGIVYFVKTPFEFGFMVGILLSAYYLRSQPIIRQVTTYKVEPEKPAPEPAPVLDAPKKKRDLETALRALGFKTETVRTLIRDNYDEDLPLEDLVVKCLHA